MPQDLTSPSSSSPRTPHEIADAALPSSDVCVAILAGRELRYTAVNPAYAAIAPGVDMVGRRLRDVFPTATESGTEAQLLHVLETGEPWKLARHRSSTKALAERTWEGEALRLATAGLDGPGVVLFVRDVTERVRMEERLQRREEELRELDAKLKRTLERITDGVLVIDADWRYTLVSERAAQILGLRPEELVGGVVWELFPHAEGTKFHEGYLRAMATQQPVHFEEHYPAPLDLWLECHCYPSKDELTVYFRDLTAKRRAERALRENEALLRAISDTSTDAIFAKDREGRMRFANPTTLGITGKPLDEVLGRTDVEFLGDAHAARGVMENDRQVIASGEPSEVEEVVPMPDGAARVWLSRKVPYRDETGAVVGLLGIARDITERKRAEDEMRAAHATLQRTLASITDGFCVLDRSFRFTFLSETGAAMLGVHGRELMGVCAWDAFPYAKDARFGDELRRALETGEPVHFEELYPEPLNKWLECHAYPSEDGLSVYFRDVSERKHAEEALRDSDRRKSEFLAVLSHELRNPLAPILSGLHILERVPSGSPQAARATEVVRRQTEHLTRLVDDLLDTTRISRGKIALRRARIDLRDIVRRTTDDLRSVFTRAGVDLRVEHVIGPIWVNADGTRLAQVLGNLLQNAVKFTPRGGAVAVHVTRERGRATLRVKDTGIGMDPTTIERMFEPFAQAEQTLARTMGGLGLGLALVRSLVEMHEGKVTAHSEGDGRGTEVRVELPAVGSGEMCALEPAPTARPDGRRVLVVEDNDDAAATLADLLEMYGHEVHVAHDGRSGIALARELRPDVVLCDLGLPDIDGYEVAKSLRQDDRLARIRLVALSGYAQPEDVERSHAAGFEAHLAKPPKVDRLLALLAAG